MAEFVFAPAVKEQEKARIALEGPAGSGKTWSALSIAQGLGQRLAVIDTEKGSASKYAGDFAFETVKLYTYDPRDLPKALSAAAAREFDVVIVDSLSHFWMGTNGLLAQVDRITRQSQSKNSWSAWKDANPMEQDMIDALLTYPGHVIVTMRTKTEWVVTEDEKGKKSPQKIGTKPVQREGLEYEFDLVGDLDLDNTLAISKTRISTLHGRVIPRPDAALGEIVREWLSDGVKLPTVREYLEQLDAATDAEQVRELYRAVMARNLGAAPCTNSSGQATTLIALITERGAMLGGQVAPRPPQPPPGQVQRSKGAPEDDPWATQPEPPPELTVEQAAAKMRANDTEGTQAAPAKPKPSTNAQRVKLVLLISEKLGIVEDRDARLAAYSSFVARPVASGNELTSAEASRMIDDLSKRPDVPKPEPAAAAPNPRNGDGPPLSPESAAAFDKAYAATEPPAASDEGSWSHRQLAERGTPLPPPGWTREQGDHLAADFLTELNSASNDKECDEIASRIASAVKAGKISPEDRGTLLAIYNGQKQDRARAKATT